MAVDILVVKSFDEVKFYKEKFPELRNAHVVVEHAHPDALKEITPNLVYISDKNGWMAEVVEYAVKKSVYSGWPLVTLSVAEGEV